VTRGSSGGNFISEEGSDLTGLFLAARELSLIDNLFITDEVFFARLRSDALDRGVAGDEIVELGLDDSVVTVDVGDANAAVCLEAVCLDAFLDKLAAVLVAIFLAL